MKLNAVEKKFRESRLERHNVILKWLPKPGRPSKLLKIQRRDKMPTVLISVIQKFSLLK
jgi:hypothetical protein